MARWRIVCEMFSTGQIWKFGRPGFRFDTVKCSAQVRSGSLEGLGSGSTRLNVQHRSGLEVWKAWVQVRHG